MRFRNLAIVLVYLLAVAADAMKAQTAPAPAIQLKESYRGLPIPRRSPGFCRPRNT